MSALAPWTYRKDRTVADANGVPILRFYADRTTEAERHMATAAPELYEALETIARAAANPDDPVVAAWLRKANAALAKARGE